MSGARIMLSLERARTCPDPGAGQGGHRLHTPMATPLFGLSLHQFLGARFCPLVPPSESAAAPTAVGLTLDARGCFSRRGLDVLAFNNWYDGAFSDAKIAGVELIHHGIRTATNGDVRLEPTPGQWDAAPEMIERKVLPAEGAIEIRLAYKSERFDYTIRVERAGDGVRLRVRLDQPLPAGLVGRAGFNLEFLPSAYFSKTYLGRVW